MRVRLKPPFAHYGGHCWTDAVDPSQFPESDDPTDPSRSCLVLSEDGADLGPQHTAHQEIAAQGTGGYSHWNGTLYFSASDGSNPNRNGRLYEARWDTDAYFAARARRAIAIAHSWQRRLGNLDSVRDAMVLEIGPGRDLGTPLLLAALGARHVVAVDRFKAAWQAGWHEHYLPKLKAAIAHAFPGADASVVDRALERRFEGLDFATFLSAPMEELPSRIGERFDLTLSHSTFEHFYDFEAAAKSIAALTQPGGRGVHDVDFRDHSNFGEPLEFLLLNAREYQNPAVNDDYARGNRVRPAEMREALLTAGFQRADFHPEARASDEYLQRLVHRLRRSASAHAHHSGEDLAILSGTFVLTK